MTISWAKGADRHFIQRAMQAPLLSRSEEQRLALRWHQQGCERSLSQLTLAYLRLVVAQAARYRHYGLPAADLIQEGTVGLMEAAARFDPEREVRFSTYANWWIRAAIQDFVLRNWSIVRTGTTAAHKALFFNLKRLKARIGTDSGSRLSADQRASIARELGVRLKDVEAMEGRLAAHDHSLNTPLVEAGGQEWQDLLVADIGGPEHEVMDRDTARRRRDLIRAAMAHLSPREALIIERRMMTEEVLTLARLGADLGISKERVRQLEAQALDKLRAAILNAVDAGEAAELEAGHV